MACELNGLREERQNFVSDDSRLCSGIIQILAEILEHDRKFVASHACNGVVFTNACGEAATDFLE